MQGTKLAHKTVDDVENGAKKMLTFINYKNGVRVTDKRGHFTRGKTIDGGLIGKLQYLQQVIDGHLSQISIVSNISLKVTFKMSPKSEFHLLDKRTIQNKNGVFVNSEKSTTDTVHIHISAQADN